jgi:glycosyltransferase involved in cell wall biosynthesis
VIRPLVSVVVPSFNRVRGLEHVLTAFERQRPDDLPFEVVVVDDGSTDGTSELVASWRSRRFALRFAQQANSGPARARNRALQLASGELVLFGGDDIEPHPELLLEHVSEHRRRGDPRAAVLGHISWPAGIELTSTMRHIDGPGGQQFSYAAFSDGGEYDFRHFYTSNVSLRSDLLAREPGGFATEFPAAAFEDADLAYRLAAHGMRIFYHRAAQAWHHHFYDAAGFFRRQVRCGEMAQVLITRHPELAKWVGLRTILWQRLEVLAGGPGNRARVGRVSEELEVWERRSIALAAFLDTPATDVADPLLRALFRYAFVKGLVTARFEGEAGTRMVADQWLRLLPAAVVEVVRRARDRGLPLPAADVRAVLEIGAGSVAA